METKQKKMLLKNNCEKSGENQQEKSFKSIIKSAVSDFETRLSGGQQSMLKDDEQVNRYFLRCKRDRR